MARRLVVEIIGDADSLEKAFARSSKSAQRFQAQISGVGSSITRGLLGFAGITTAAYGVATAFRTGFDEMRESRKVAAQTAAALKSTGGVAGVTADHVAGLADQLMHLSGVDDELIQSSENVLLTFRNVRNAVGQGNDIFDQAAQAALDLSVRMGTDLNSAILQVGKALQDPVRGMTALRRAGVSFTEAQQKTIRRLVESNRLMDAQKMILQELSYEFGGSAQAAGNADGGLSRLGHTIENFLGMLVEKFMPSIERATTALQKWFDNPENVERVSDAVEGLAGALGDLAAFAGDVKKTGNDVQDFFRDMEIVSNKATKAVVERFSSLTGGLGSGMVEDIEKEIRRLEGISADAGADAGKAWANAFATEGLRAKDIIEGRMAAGGLLPPTAFEEPATGGGGKTPTERATQRNRWFDASIARAQERAQSIADLKKIAARLRERIKVTKDVTRRMRLEDELWRTNQEIAQKTAQQAQERKDTQLGWLEFALEKAEVTKSIKDDLKALKALESYWKERIRQEGKTLDLMRELWRVQQAIKDQGKKNGDGDPLAGLMQVSTRRLTSILAAGTGLGAAGRRVLGANISAQQLRPIYMSVQLDGREVSKSVTQNQARSGKRTGKQTSGRRG